MRRNGGEGLAAVQDWSALDAFLENAWEQEHEYDRFAVDTRLLLGRSAIRRWDISPNNRDWPALLDQRFEELVEGGFVTKAKERALASVRSDSLSRDFILKLAGDCHELTKLHVVQRFWQKHYLEPRLQPVGADEYHRWLEVYARVTPIKASQLRQIGRGGNVMLALSDVQLVPLTRLESGMPKPGYRKLDEPHEYAMLVPPHVTVSGDIGGAVIYDWATMKIRQNVHTTEKDIVEFPATRGFLRDRMVPGFSPAHDLADTELRLLGDRQSELPAKKRAAI